MTDSSSGRPPRIAIAGGGTGGHVQPAVATLHVLRRDHRLDAIWIGSNSGVERAAAEAAGVPFHPIQTGKLRRYLSLQTPVDAARVPIGILQATRILREFQPSVVFSTGGFVSVPTVAAARILGVPALTHEQTAIVGLATRINSRLVDVVALSHEHSRSFLPADRARVVITGNPVRSELLGAAPGAAREAFGLDASLPLIYVTGGAQGAQAINETVRKALPELTSLTQIVHQCGPAAINGDLPRLLAARDQLPEERHSRYVIRETIGAELGSLYAAADLVIGRAGAGTVSELTALGKPSILIPLPGAGGDEQTVSARMLQEAGASVLIPQRDLTPTRLVDEVRRLLGDADARNEMSERARALGRPNAAELLAREIVALAEGRRP